VIKLDAATFLLQWATGGLFFLWVTTRRREVGLGYGWLLRGCFAVLALGAVAAGQVTGKSVWLRDVSAAVTSMAALASMTVSIVRRRAGVAGQRERLARVRERVPVGATGIERDERDPVDGIPEFPPVLDLIAPIAGTVGLVAGAVAAGGPHGLAIIRVLAGAAFLGAVTDAMLLGHWYLVQPGLGRSPLRELTMWVAALWVIEVAALLWPTGMVSVLNGSIDDGYGGILGWFWLACVVTTIVLCFVTRAALKERSYSAVMAATGLLYLAILTAFGTDLVARAVLAK
jgi:hypothetical protein